MSATTDAPGLIAITKDDATRYASLDSFRRIWWPQGWTSTEDPDWDGDTLTQVEAPPFASTADLLELDGRLDELELDGIGVTDGDKGDVEVSGVGTVWTVPALVTLTAADAALDGRLDSIEGVSGATDAELAAAVAAEALLARNADNLTSGTVADARIAATIARDSEVTAAVAAEATLARNADNLTSGTVVDARIDATIARDSEVTAAVAAEATLARNADNLTSGTVNDARIPSTITRDSELTAAVQAAIDALLAGAPGALDTLDELAAAVGDDANFAAAVTTALAGKQPLDADLTAIAALTTTSIGRSLLAAADDAALRTILGLGNMATQAKTAVDITGGTVVGITDLAVADGGTGASTAPAALTNLGFSAFVKTLVDDADAAAARLTLGAANATPIVCRRSAAYTASELYWKPILGLDSSEPTNGTFTAISDDNIVFDVDLSINSDGPASTYWMLYVEVGGSGLMFDVSGAVTDNAKAYMIGGVAGNGAGFPLSAKVVITKANHATLAAGQTIRWTLIPFIIGISAAFACVDGPLDMSIQPNGLKMWVVKILSNAVQPLTLPPAQSLILEKNQGPVAGPSIPVGATPIKVRAGNSQVYVANFGGGTVTTISSTTEKVVRSTVVTANNPYGLALKADESTLYVCTYQGNVFPITTSTGALGAQVTVGAAKILRDCVLNAAETKLFVCNETDSTLRAITLPNTLGTAIALSAVPRAVRLNPVDGTIWVLTTHASTLGNNKLMQIDPATETVLQSITLAYVNAKSFAIGSEGVTAWVTYDGGKYSEVFLGGLIPSALVPYHSGQIGSYAGLMETVVIDRLDQVYLAMYDADQIFFWPGTKITVTPDIAYFGGRAVVTIRP